MYCNDRYAPLLADTYKQFGASKLALALSFATNYQDVFSLQLPPAVSDLDFRAVQLVRLVRLVESSGLSKILRKLQKDFAAVLTEKARDEEDVLPTDLWRKQGITENFTIPRPQMVAQFVAELQKAIIKEDTSAEVVEISVKGLDVALQTLSSACLSRERFAYESYSNFYENLLRRHHRELYARERDIVALKTDVDKATSSSSALAVERMAANCQDLLMEVTALRQRSAELATIQKQRDDAVRLEVKADYAKLVNAMVGSSFQLRARFDAFKHRIAGETDELINETKAEVLAKLHEFANKSTAGHQAKPVDEEEDAGKYLPRMP
jgi:hypothetical protein